MVFPDFYYDQNDADKEYIYKITEDQFDIPGVSRDTDNGPNEIYAKVKVGSDDGEGKLEESTVTYFGDAGCTQPLEKSQFVNKYEASGHTYAEVAKHRTGRDLEEGEFTFTISAVDNAPIKDKDGKAITSGLTVGNGADGEAAAFPDFYYDQNDAEKTYVYKIEEDQFTIAGVSRDTENGPEEIYAKVEVGKDNKDGTLADSIVTYYSDEDCKTPLEKSQFVNKYEAKGEGEIKVQKFLKGRDWTNSDSFTFSISAAEGTPMPGQKSITIRKSDKNQTKSFGKIAFTKAGIYTYKIKESKGSIGGVTYDETEHTVTIKVRDNGKGELVADGGKLVQTEAFTNTYHVAETIGEVMVQKVLDGRKWNDNDEFEFTISAPAGTPMPEERSISITKEDADHIVSFGEIEFTEAGKYTYTIKETKGNEKGMTYDTKAHKVTIEVVDDGNGKLKAKSGSKLIQTVKITNTYRNHHVTTGDDNKMLSYISIMLGAMLGFVMMLIYHRKRRA